jgi:hypothetical protein
VNICKQKKCRDAKTYNSGDSPVVTHLTTNPPIHCLTRAERTGSRDLNVLWSYVKEMLVEIVYIQRL